MGRAKNLRRKFTKAFPAWHVIEYLFVRAAFAFINLFPIRISTSISRRMGDIAFLILPKRKKIALQNITIAFGSSKTTKEKSKIARESFRNLTTCIMEFFRFPKAKKTLEGHYKIRGVEHIDGAVAKKKGVIIAMAHLGPWEYVGFPCYLRKYKGATLGRPVKNPYLYRWIKSLREMMTLEYIDKDAGPKKIFSKLKENYVVGIAIDQWAGNDGMWVDFFGKPTSTTSIPAEFAKRTGCAIVPICCLRVAPGEYEMHAEPEVYVNGDDKDYAMNTTKELNRRLERKIRSFPEQWLWSHKRWKKI